MNRSKRRRLRPSNADQARLSITYRLIATLALNSFNPRRHSNQQIRQIALSIQTFGFLVPVLIDRKGKVIAGHGRIAAALLLGMTEVPTICLEHLSEAQARALMIADNKLTENSEWDERLLAQSLKELSVLELDFSLEVTGFEMGEIDLLIEGLKTEVKGEEDPADAKPIKVGPVVTRAGDLWRLERHLVYCGSALEVAAFEALVQRELAAMVFSDPPYNVRIAGNVSGLGSIHHREFPMASGEMDEVEYIRFLTAVIALLVKRSVEGSLIYICIDWRHLRALLAAGDQVGLELKNVCVWVKSNAGMGSFYRSQYELVVVFKHHGGGHRNNIQLGRFGRNRSNVWNYPSVSAFGRTAGGEGDLLALHPTVKPVALVADAILDCTTRGDLVLDAFLGSGTTVIAAERTGRRCYGLELDPIYVDTIGRRWQGFTGDNAVHAASGRLFCELEAEVEEHHVE